MTPVARYIVHEYVAHEKVWACKKLLKIIGGEREKPGRDELVKLLAVRFGGCATGSQVAAADVLLEYFVPGWRSTVPPELFGEFVERDWPEVERWRNAVLKRDSYRCRKCGAGEELHAHHIARWADSPELRLVVENGLTVCRACHQQIHAKRSWH